jgi:hypothetical protein
MTRFALSNFVFGLLAVAGIYLTVVIAIQNETVDRLLQYHEHSDSEPVYLPGTSHQIRTVYTGIKAIDKWFIAMVVFFWPVAQANLPEMSLHWISFGSEFAATWTLILLEATRPQNKGRWIS